MCTKTKNSYGCGHHAKIFEPCGDRHCDEVTKYAMPPRESDCAKCKAGGDNVTRGIDGRGRYGRQIHSRRSSSDSYVSSSPVPIPNMSISPWSAEKQQASANESIWDWPTRRMVDDAWVVEHARRESDLEQLSSKVSQSGRSRRPSFSSSRKNSPNSSYERIIDIRGLDEVTESLAESLDLECVPGSRTRKHHSRAIETDLSRSQHTRYSSDHKSRRTTPAIDTPTRRPKLLSASRSEYDAPTDMQLVRRPRRSATASETYAYAAPAPPPPRAHHVPFVFESPMSGSPLVASGWETQYQVASAYTPVPLTGYYQQAYVPPVH